MITLILLTAITTVFLEKVYHFSTSINGIERSNIAYYNATSLIETQLMTGAFTKYDPWKVAGKVNTGSTFSGEVMTVFTGSRIVPDLGKWDSPFDSDYNLITLGEPVQLVIPDRVDWTQVRFTFRIPRIGTATNTGVDPLSPAWSGYILWTFWNSGATLFASGETEIVILNDINHAITIDTKNGITNSGSASRFDNFYTNANYVGPNGDKCVGFNCTLKLSLIRPVPVEGISGQPGRKLPFLEYKIDFWPGIMIPNQRMTIQSQSYVNGFIRSTTVYLPQITTNTALDFAILQ
jgi:hypothetical protein